MDNPAPYRNIYAMATARSAILEATPKEVWKEYLENGYSLIEAADEELSYAE
jgi:hypothetical protein